MPKVKITDSQYFKPHAGGQRIDELFFANPLIRRALSL